ncbi:MAG: hypothetical protein K0S18_157 [Anaerocolumna sp.]|jgi:hypothetical protein|nr:hypothetical protein [Anaerocolumna sp.]
MTFLDLINETGNADLIRLFLQDKINKLDLANAIGNSNTDLVITYKNQVNSK